MANILAAQSAEMRAKGEAMIQQADKLLCESWNERMWSDGEPIDPSPTIDQAVNGGFPWLEIRCARCKTPSDVDLAGDEASADHLRARSSQPAALPKMRQGGPTPRSDPATTGLAAAPSSNRPLTMCNLYSITTNQAAIIALFRVVNRYVGNLAPMPGVFPDYKAPIVRNGAEGRELATARWGMPSSSKALMDATKKRAEKLQAKGKTGRLQGIAPDGAGRRHDQHPQREEQTLDAMARRREPLRGAVQLASASSTRPRAATSGSRSTRPGRSPASPASGPTGRRSGRSRKARPPTTSTRS